MQTHSPEPDNHARLRSLNQLKNNGKKKGSLDRKKKNKFEKTKKKVLYQPGRIMSDNYA